MSFLDLRFAWRNLARRPAFTLAVVLALALGIGASTAIFSVVYTVALRPLPWPEPERLVSFTQPDPESPGGRRAGGAADAFLLSHVEELQDRARSFEGISAYWTQGYTLSGGERPVRLEGMRVHADLFPVLGVAPLHGRVFSAEEVEAGERRLAVLSYRAWQRRLGGDPERIGGTLELDGEAWTVLGVTPEGFSFPRPEIDLWTPLFWETPSDPHEQREVMLPVIGRLAAGVTIEQAQAEGNLLLAELERERGLLRSPPGGAAPGSTASGEAGPGQASDVDRSPGSRRAAVALPGLDPVLRLQSFRERQLEPIRPALAVLAGAVALLLLVACANVAHLLLARGLQRRRELATRAALGAGSRGLARLLFSESLLLSLAGAGLGMLLAGGGLRVLRALDPGRFPGFDELALNGPVLLFALGLALGCALVFGLLPALQARRADLLSALGRESAPTSGHGSVGGALRGLLAVAEVALALVLAIGAGLLAYSFVTLIRVDPGFEPDGVVVGMLTPPSARYPAGEARNAFWDRLVDRVEALPEVERAGGVNFLPPVRGRIVLDFSIEGTAEPEDPAERPRADLRIVVPGYFEAMGIRLLDGRTLDERDREGSPPVVVVNESFARRWLADREAVGQRLRRFGEIVGVVADVRAGGLESEPEPTFYLTQRQAPPMMGALFERFALVVKTERPKAVLAALPGLVHELDPRVPLEETGTLAQRLSDSIALPRFYAAVLSSFAGVALLLAVLGVYSVLSFLVSERTRETGIRMALGAGRRRVVLATLWQGLRLALTGVALGLLGAWALRRVLAGLLFGVEPGDPATFVAMALVLLLTAALACWLPARRAATVDPVRALREE